MGQSASAVHSTNETTNIHKTHSPPVSPHSDPISELYQAGKTNILFHQSNDDDPREIGKKSKKSKRESSSSTSTTLESNHNNSNNKGYISRLLHSTSESESTSLHSLLADEDEDDSQEEEQAHHHRSEVTTKRWLLSSTYEGEQVMSTHEHNCLLCAPNTFKQMMMNTQNGSTQIRSKIVETIILMACTDLWNDCCKLRLVCKLFNQVIEEHLNFVAFQFNHKSLFMEDDNSEETENAHQCSERNTFCHKLKISRKVLSYCVMNTKQHQDQIPKFLSNTQQIHYCFNMNDTECKVKLTNPLIQSCALEGAKNGNNKRLLFLQELEFFIEISQTAPHNFSIIAVSRETSSYEECLFSFHTWISITNSQRSESSNGLLSKTRLYPHHKKMFFESPTKTSAQPSNMPMNLNFDLTKGRYLLKFQLSKNNSMIQVKVIDIERQIVHYELEEMPLMPYTSTTEHSSPTNHSRAIQQLTSPLMIDHFLIITSSSDRNICKRATLSTSIIDSGA
ncbi:hypothetical protein C9374_009928 [Naegleria lovaniensis]|uniref:Uncharacterized protein n=1 Tax=Naegleria lovaniensis TaxID=51637 RepID=A0AA88KE59_NAELO|nr:uncharacterized protein C9374_009928 [Naegleria lovaniensis]KAG2375305.1 hypothetical protein C9374_009928 [Naegleria lovaniensis]